VEVPGEAIAYPFTDLISFEVGGPGLQISRRFGMPELGGIGFGAAGAFEAIYATPEKLQAAETAGP
jgi:hypothetical protein